MRNKTLISFLIVIFFYTKLNAQCSMCKAVVEANLKEGGSAGAGLNEGILYLMAMPYIAVIIFGLFYFLQKRNQKQTS
jgi:hypothetical protein|tara:strand:+ start:825 stop:1058 length:234 start_codon:yes stop_codon:yes gene_type:complete